MGRINIFNVFISDILIFINYDIYRWFEFDFYKFLIIEIKIYIFIGYYLYVKDCDGWFYIL